MKKTQTRTEMAKMSVLELSDTDLAAVTGGRRITIAEYGEAPKPPPKKPKG